MNQEQLNSFVRSLLKVIGAILVAHGASKAAAIVNTEDVAGIVVTLVGLFMSHQQHESKPVETVGDEATRRPLPPALLTSCPTNMPRATEAVNSIAGVADIRHS